MNRKMICFDMDGTIADLYAVPNWLEMLRNEDATPYMVAAPMWNMEALADVCNVLINQGWEIRVITWLAMDSTEDYKNAVRLAKLDWLIKYGFPAEKIHMVAYGTTKANVVRKYAESAILIDDNDKVRHGWTLGRAINPVDTDIIAELWKLVDTVEG
jgi:5'(3')-deoxyribonucleotidase